MLIWIDEKTFDVRVQHTPGEVFVPNAESIAITQLAEKLRAQLTAFRSQYHDPMVQELICTIGSWY